MDAVNRALRLDPGSGSFFGNISSSSGSFCGNISSSSDDDDDESTRLIVPEELEDLLEELLELLEELEDVAFLDAVNRALRLDPISSGSFFGNISSSSGSFFGNISSSSSDDESTRLIAGASARTGASSASDFVVDFLDLFDGRSELIVDFESVLPAGRLFGVFVASSLCFRSLANLPRSAFIWLWMLFSDFVLAIHRIRMVKTILCFFVFDFSFKF